MVPRPLFPLLAVSFLGEMLVYSQNLSFKVGKQKTCVWAWGGGSSDHGAGWGTAEPVSPVWASPQLQLPRQSASWPNEAVGVEEMARGAILSSPASWACFLFSSLGLKTFGDRLDLRDIGLSDANFLLVTVLLQNLEKMVTFYLGKIDTQCIHTHARVQVKAFTGWMPCLYLRCGWPRSAHRRLRARGAGDWPRATIRGNARAGRRPCGALSWLFYSADCLTAEGWHHFLFNFKTWDSSPKDIFFNVKWVTLLERNTQSHGRKGRKVWEVGRGSFKPLMVTAVISFKKQRHVSQLFEILWHLPTHLTAMRLAWDEGQYSFPHISPEASSAGLPHGRSLVGKRLWGWISLLQEGWPDGEGGEAYGSLWPVSP